MNLIHLIGPLLIYRQRQDVKTSVALHFTNPYKVLLHSILTCFIVRLLFEHRDLVSGMLTVYHYILWMTFHPQPIHSLPHYITNSSFRYALGTAARTHLSQTHSILLVECRVCTKWQDTTLYVLYILFFFK